MKELPNGDYVRDETQDFLFKVGDKVPTASTPEPGTLLGLLGVGALGLGTAAKRRQEQNS
ncbi:MAG: PEP-CTERM sorting domain-containing protein [Oscillatoria sp. SIO1A7]|nr:PEP-CTERM sorting domain-containing protein [Oscillatoria sp. SIO1A7]